MRLYDSAGRVRPSTLASRIADVSARGIAHEVLQLVRTGELAAGVRLPPVRALAVCLHVGPTTVAAAWALLRNNGIVRTDGRAGTFVEDRDGLPGRRFLRVVSRPCVDLDLTRSIPDSSWLPDLGSAIDLARGATDWRSYQADPADPMLLSALARAWPFQADDFTVTNSGLDAVMLSVESAVGPGDRVLIEESCAPELHDIVELLRAVPVPVSCDDAGPLPDSVRAGLAHQPRLMLLQPRMANPTGHSLTAERARELAEVLAERPLVIVEHDVDPALSTGPPISIGSMLPDQTVIACGWNRSHGPQLRVGALGGAQYLVSRVRARQNLTATWPSLINQRALAIMLADAKAQMVVRCAARTYQDRRERLIRSIARCGFEVTGSGGLSAWIPVPSATQVLQQLRRRRIGICSGTPFTNDALANRYVRIATTIAHDRHDDIAVALERAGVRASR